MNVTNYAVPGQLTEFSLQQTAMIRQLGLDAEGLCRAAQGLLASPLNAVRAGLSKERMAERDIRPACALLQRSLELDATTPLDQPRPTPRPARPEDLRSGEFRTAGEAWQLIRSGDEDPATFGVFGTENWGPGEVRGNAMRDLASVWHKIEMLPWDEWGICHRSSCFTLLHSQGTSRVCQPG